MLTPKEKAEILALAEKHEVIKKLWEAHQRPAPANELRNESALMISHLAKEMEALREGRLEDVKIFTSDEKLFERINLVLTNSEKYLNGLDKVMEFIDPTTKPKDTGKKKTQSEPLAF